MSTFSYFHTPPLASFWSVTRPNNNRSGTTPKITIKKECQFHHYPQATTFAFFTFFLVFFFQFFSLLLYGLCFLKTMRRAWYWQAFSDVVNAATVSSIEHIDEMHFTQSGRNIRDIGMGFRISLNATGNLSLVAMWPSGTIY